MLYRVPIMALLLLLLMPGLALAQQNWSLSGFASLAAGKLADEGLQYQDYTDDQWDLEGDSVLGLQLNLNLAERLSLTAQMISRGYSWDDTDAFEPVLDWLFVGYQLNDAWRMRLGRMRTPLYLYSETLDVGYSYVWARPPIDVYAPITLPFSNFDGADLVYLTDWGDYSLDAQLLAGTTRRSRDTLEINVDPLLGGNLTLRMDQLTLRYGLLMLQTDITLSDIGEIQALYQAAGQLLDPVFSDVNQQLSANDNWYRYQTLGLRWDLGKFSVTGEVFDIHNTEDGYTNNAQGWYLSLQYRIDQVTPYLVAGRHKNEFNQDTLQTLGQTYEIWPEGQTVLLFQEQVDQLDQLRVDTRAFIESLNFEHHTWTVGVRYDIHPHVALKAEWQYFDFVSGISHFVVTTPNPPDHTSMTTFILDVVF
jgi:opacity protein-like surface antigen